VQQQPQPPAPVRRSPQEDERLVVDLIGVVNRLDKQMRCNIRDALARLSATFAARSAGAAAEVAPAAQGDATRQAAAKDEAGAGGSLVVGQPVLGANVWRAVDDSVAGLLFHQWP
jgi:phage host-nuclease inhibitor protein Gam